jgi:hypothetical protein
VHLRVWVPIGAVAVVLPCLAPPVASFWVTYSHRDALDMPAVRNRFGFLYARYKRSHYYWESVLHLRVGRSRIWVQL